MLQVLRQLVLRVLFLLNSWVLHRDLVLLAEGWVIVHPMLLETHSHRIRVKGLQIRQTGLAAIIQATIIVTPLSILHHLLLLVCMLMEVKVVVQLALQTFIDSEYHSHTLRLL